MFSSMQTTGSQGPSTSSQPGGSIGSKQSSRGTMVSKESVSRFPKPSPPVKIPVDAEQEAREEQQEFGRMISAL